MNAKRERTNGHSRLARTAGKWKGNRWISEHDRTEWNRSTDYRQILSAGKCNDPTVVKSKLAVGSFLLSFDRRRSNRISTFIESKLPTSSFFTSASQSAVNRHCNSALWNNLQLLFFPLRRLLSWNNVSICRVVRFFSLSVKSSPRRFQRSRWLFFGVQLAMFSDVVKFL